MNHPSNSPMLSFVGFDNSDEAAAIGKLITDLSIQNVIHTNEGFFCLNEKRDELFNLFEKHLAVE